MSSLTLYINVQLVVIKCMGLLPLVLAVGHQKRNQHLGGTPLEQDISSTVRLFKHRLKIFGLVSYFFAHSHYTLPLRGRGYLD